MQFVEAITQMLILVHQEWFLYRHANGCPSLLIMHSIWSHMVHTPLAICFYHHDHGINEYKQPFEVTFEECFVI